MTPEEVWAAVMREAAAARAAGVAVRNASRYIATREELRRHARMRHPEGRAFHGSCLCEWVGPNTAFNDHVAAEITNRLEREGL